MPDGAKAKPQARSWWLFVGGAGLAALILAAAMLWLITPRHGTSVKSGEPAGPDAGDPASWGKWEAGAPTAAEMRVVELAYFDPIASAWKMARQPVPLPEDEAGKLAAVVGAWLAAAARADQGQIVPPGSAVRDAFVLDGRRAYLNFSPEFARNAGITAELERIVGLAKTIRANFPGVTDVQILIAGRAVDTLSGQLAVSAPLQVAYFADMGG